MREKLGRTLAAIGMAAMTSPAWAAYGNEGALGSFLDQSANWLVTVLGPGIFVIGVIMVGISLSIGDQDAMRKGGYVIGGGALIFLSQAVVALLKRMAGGF
jgi:type IV secretory pathway VirB2 component (pilin)